MNGKVTIVTSMFSLFTSAHAVLFMVLLHMQSSSQNSSDSVVYNCFVHNLVKIG